MSYSQVVQATLPCMSVCVCDVLVASCSLQYAERVQNSEYQVLSNRLNTAHDSRTRFSCKSFRVGLYPTGDETRARFEL